MVKFVPTYTKGTLKKKKKKKERSAKNLPGDVSAMFKRFFSDFLYKSIFCGCSFELHRVLI